MNHIRKITVLSLGLILLLIVFPGNAHACLDPGTGSYVLQIILAAAVGGLFVIKQYFGRIKAFFAGLFSQEKSDNGE